MSANRPPVTKIANKLFRHTRLYANKVLAKYQLSCGTYPFLLNLDGNEGINQNQLSKELGVDKALAARAIKQLIKLGYMEKRGDPEDLRAYCLFLTEKAKSVVPAVRADMRQWETIITQGLEEREIEQMMSTMEKVLHNAKNHREGC